MKKSDDNLMFSKQAVEKYTHAMKHFKVQQLTRGSIKEFIRLRSDKIVHERPPEIDYTSDKSFTTAPSMKDIREAQNLKKETETRKGYVAFVKNQVAYQKKDDLPIKTKVK